MDIPNIDRLNTILKRYKLDHRILNDDDIEIGGGHNIKYLKRYYFYIPLIIGSVIVLLGFLIDFIFLMFCGAPFLLYAIYGIGQINSAIKENRNTTIVNNGEIKISENDRIKVFNAQNIKRYEIKTESLDDKRHFSKLILIDKENKEQMFLILIDDELPVLEENMKFIKDFIQRKINASNTRLAQEQGQDSIKEGNDEK